jgi:hypothetical protein
LPAGRRPGRRRIRRKREKDDGGAPPLESCEILVDSGGSQGILASSLANVYGRSGLRRGPWNPSGEKLMTESRMGSRAPKARFAEICFSLAVVVGLFAAGAIAPARAEASLQLTYDVSHSMFGHIGTYTNTILPTTGGTTVETQTNFLVRLLGMQVYSEQAQRTEEWHGNRLISYQSVTDKNGNQPLVVKGVARGNSFVISSPDGTITAPANVRPANPWSAVFLGSNTMMRPDTGALERVHVTSLGPATVALNGRTIPTQSYEVDGSKKYVVYLDGRGVPVEFTVADSAGQVTFRLIKCGGCALAVSYLGNYNYR